MAVYEFKKSNGEGKIVWMRSDPMEWLEKQPDKDEYVSVCNCSQGMMRWNLQNDFADLRDPGEKGHSLKEFMDGSTYEIVP